MRPDWPAQLGDEKTTANEYRLVHRDGHVLWVRDMARLVHSADGTPLFWQGVMLDVTEQHEAEDERLRSEARYRTLVEQAPGIVYIDTNEPDPAPMYVSPQVLELTGYTVEEWMTDRSLWLNAAHPDDRERLRKEWVSSIGRRAPFSIEYRSVHRDGRVSWFHDSARLVRDDDGKPLFWQGLIQDISDAKRAEEMMSESERRHRTLVEQVPAVVFIDSHEESPVCYYVSPQSTEMLGYRPEEFQNDPSLFFRIIHPEDLDRVAAAWVDAVRHSDSFFCDFRLFRRDGEMLFVREAAVLIRDVDGAPVYWQGLIQDLSDRKRAEDSFRASEARYRMLVEQVPAVVYEMDPDDERRTLFVSPQVEALFGYSREEWLDQPDIWTELLHPDDREIELAAHDLHNETGEPWIQEYRLIASDGRVVWVRDQARLVRDESGNALDVAGHHARHHVAEGHGGAIPPVERRSGVPCPPAHVRARGSERDDVARDRRAQTHRVRAAGDPGTVPAAGRGPPRGRVHVAGPRCRRLPALHEPAHREAARVLSRGVEHQRHLESPPPSTRPRSHPGRLGAERDHR